MKKSWIFCEEVIDQLFDYLDSEVNSSTNSEIEQHLERCHDCFSRVKFEHRLRERIAGSGHQEAPETLRRRISELIHQF